MTDHLRAQRRLARRFGRPTRVRDSDEAAVSDVVGSILMVAITVITSVVLGGLLLTFQGPVPVARVQLAVTSDPGTGGWGTGDESVRILHAGGDPLRAANTVVMLSVSGTATRLSGTSQLGSTWADGQLTIGETWQSTRTIAAGAPVSVTVVDTSQTSQAVLTNTVFTTSTTSTTNPCASDVNAPTVLQWSQTPATITALTTGSVSVVVQVGDNCWGPNPSVAPQFNYRIYNGVNIAYTNTGAMTNVGSNRWAATIPSQTWSSLVGQQVQYYLTQLIDLGGNSGQSEVRTSTVLSDCSTDIVPPTYNSVTQSPNDVRTTTVGAVTVTVVTADDCAGIDQTQNPHIFYRFNSGSGGSYTDGGSMTKTATSTWQGTIPAQTWALLSGQVLEYYVTGVRDLNGNLGTTGVQQDTIDIITTYNYVTSNTPTTGTVSAFANMQSAVDSGAEGTVAEGATVGSPNTQTFNANGVILANGWTSATASFASDDSWATYATNSPTTSNDFRVTLQDPAVSGTVTSVIVRAELSITSANNDGFQLQACLSTGACNALGTAIVASATDTTYSYDVTSVRPGGGTWTLTDITNLEPVVHLTQQGTRDGTWRIDRIWADVTIQTTSYSTNVQLDFAGVPAGAGVHSVELKYRVTGDTFNVQVCQDLLASCAVWTTRGTVLNAGSSTTWTYTLTVAEFRAGAPRIRFTDVAPTGTTQGNLFLDYARIATL